MDTFEKNINWKKIEEEFRKLVNETKEGVPMVDNKPSLHQRWWITVPRQNEPS